nr:MAG TPA: hypothetical protein [Caudoviricetes sp.]
MGVILRLSILSHSAVLSFVKIYQLPENAPAYTVLAPDCFFTQSESFRK